jgi:biopolymer transport protein ExbB
MRVVNSVSFFQWSGTALLNDTELDTVAAYLDLSGVSPLFALIQAAGWPIWFLLAASLVAVTVIVERALYLRPAHILPPYLLGEVIEVAGAGPVDAETMAQLEQNSPLGRVLAAGVRNLSASRETMKQAIEEAGRLSAHQLERYLTTLGTVATLAPLMGLFGTVVGMIELFGAQDIHGANPVQVAHGISVALYNTAFGLAIAMPALLFHRHFHAQVDSLVIEMEQQALRFVDTVHGERR